MGNHIGRHYQSPGGTEITPSHVVNEHTCFVVDANNQDYTNATSISGELTGYFSTVGGIKTTALAPDYNQATRKFNLKEPDDGLSTMPSFVTGSDGSSSYWSFDGNTQALSPRTDLANTTSRMGDNNSTGTTVSFWLKENPISISGSQYGTNNATTGSEKQRASFFSFDNTEFEFAQDQRSLTLGVEQTYSTAAAGYVKIFNNITKWSSGDAGFGPDQYSYFDFNFPYQSSLNGPQYTHESNPNPVGTTYVDWADPSGLYVTWDFNMLGRWGTGKGPESGSILRTLYNTTSTNPDIINKELNFKVHSSSNYTNDEWNLGGISGKVVLDEADPETSASLMYLMDAVGNDGQPGDTMTFLLNTGENRLAVYKGGYEEIVSGSFRSGSHLSDDITDRKDCWTNMAFVSKGEVSTSLDVTLDLDGSPGSNKTGSAKYYDGEGSQTDGTYVRMLAGGSGGIAGDGNSDWASGNGPGFIIGRRNSNQTAITGLVDYWKDFVGKDLEVWTTSDNGTVYKGKHRIQDVVAYDPVVATDADFKGYVSIRIGGQFDTQGVVPYGQYPGNTSEAWNTQLKLRLRVSEVITSDLKIYKNGYLYKTMDTKGYTADSGSRGKYNVPFQPYEQPAVADSTSDGAWSGSYGEGGTGTTGRHNGRIYIGRSSGATPRYWRGKVAHMSVYDSSLSDADVKGNYYALKSRFEGK